MATLISIDIELNAIRSFLETVATAADSEYARIKIKSDAGEFRHYDDEANAYFVPEMWEELAIRATLGELNALVEWELQHLAVAPFFEKEQKSKNGKLKLVFDLKMNQIIQLIEDHYQIKLDSIGCYEDIKTIRKKVNSFKHRKGYKDPRKDTYRVIPEKFELSRKEAFQCIDSVRNFFRELWSITKARQHV
jgi:hypothetical protein